MAVMRVGGRRPISTAVKTTARVVESCGMVEKPITADSLLSNPASFPAIQPLPSLAIIEVKVIAMTIPTIDRLSVKTPISVSIPTTTKNTGIKIP